MNCENEERCREGKQSGGEDRSTHQNYGLKSQNDLDSSNPHGNKNQQEPLPNQFTNMFLNDERGLDHSKEHPANHHSRPSMPKSQMTLMSYNRDYVDYQPRGKQKQSTNITGQDGTGMARFKCLMCSYTSVKRYNMLRHVKTLHYKLRDDVCNICVSSYQTKKQVQDHFIKNHMPPKPVSCSKAPLKCLFCDMELENVESLQSHVRTEHLESRSFQCNQCQYLSMVKSMLAQHVASVHKKIKNFSCKRCEFKTSYSVTLKRHVQAIHEAIKPHKCEDCDYSSTQKSNLNTHIKRKHLNPHKKKAKVIAKKKTSKANLRKKLRELSKDWVTEDTKTEANYKKKEKKTSDRPMKKRDANLSIVSSLVKITLE